MPVRNIIRIDEEKCTGCGLCILSCAEGALKIVNGKAKVVSETFCDGLGACIGTCPEGALTIIQREAVDFDEKAVETHLERLKHERETAQPEPPPMACGCPGSMLRVFEAEPAPKPAAAAPSNAPAASALRQWPVQLKLLPTSGNLYDGKDVLLLADCVAVAYPDLHRKLIAGHTVVMTCPKLDHAEESIAKLAEIFKNKLHSLSIAIMEVPCCGGLVRIAQEAAQRSGVKRPIKTVTLGIRGETLEERTLS
ncbi:MAG: 4Fe-4S dicluster domain-containing protein [Myxococcales bacterium]|nr:MAG: 4Fe-4S dicluster domain-containing protein [Myxococcales bacterium]